MPDIGTVIKRRRVELGLTQQEVAEKLGITQQAYSKYERGVNSFNFETALKLGEVLDTSLDSLGLDFRQNARDRDDEICLEMYKRLNARHRFEVLKIMEQFAESESETKSDNTGA